ncbi:hypothetical protein GCM10010214_59990 [Streptomyces abikoensis]|nr:hypothetical protein GCM10010214_59990 [Streptomyces abikoensis]
MNSLTITPHGPASGRRQGRSRACTANQSITGACNRVDVWGVVAGIAVMSSPILARPRGAAKRLEPASATRAPGRPDRVSAPTADRPRASRFVHFLG